MKKLRKILVPFSALYGAGVRLHNYAYDKKILRSASFDLPVISIGNLSVGGTGKTPMTEYLIRLLSSHFQVAVLSRGYKRKTRGFLLATPESTANDVGDEPLQMYQKFPTISVAVAEQRVLGIPMLLYQSPGTELILLDDAFQHRAVKAGFNILLTDFNHLYPRDLLLPAGNLRDTRSSSRRADVIVVTKCPAEMQEAEKLKITEEINPLARQKVFFTTLIYGKPYRFSDRSEADIHPSQKILLSCAIANPHPIVKTLTENGNQVALHSFRDHHSYTLSDIQKIIHQFQLLPEKDKIIITTEKDAVKWLPFQEQLAALPVYVLPVLHKFLFEEGPVFDNDVLKYCEGFFPAK